MTALLLTALACLALGAIAGWYVRGRQQQDAGKLAGRCGAPIGRGRWCQRRPLRGSDRCGLEGHRREAKAPAVDGERHFVRADEVGS